MRELLKSLAGYKDVAGLRSTVRELCTGFGELSHFDALTLSRSGKHQTLCFFRLESAAQERRLLANLRITRFGSDLLLVVDFPPEQAKMAEHHEDSDCEGIDDDALHRGPDRNAGDRRFGFNPVRWSSTLLVGARRELFRDIEWLTKRMVR